MFKYTFTNTTKNIDDMHQYIEINSNVQLNVLFAQLIAQNNWDFTDTIMGFPFDAIAPVLHWHFGNLSMKLHTEQTPISSQEYGLYDYGDYGSYTESGCNKENEYSYYA